MKRGDGAKTHLCRLSPPVMMMMKMIDHKHNDDDHDHDHDDADHEHEGDDYEHNGDNEDGDDGEKSL